jgi:hypothetical protein
MQTLYAVSISSRSNKTQCEQPMHDRMQFQCIKFKSSSNQVRIKFKSSSNQVQIMFKSSSNKARIKFKLARNTVLDPHMRFMQTLYAVSISSRSNKTQCEQLMHDRMQFQCIKFKSSSNQVQIMFKSSSNQFQIG